MSAINYFNQRLGGHVQLSGCCLIVLINDVSIVVVATPPPPSPLGGNPRYTHPGNVVKDYFVLDFRLPHLIIIRSPEKGSQEQVNGGRKMKIEWKMFAALGVGVLLALIAPVNTVIAGVMTPVLSAITGGKGAYV